MDRLSALEAFVRLSELGTFSAVSNDLRVRQSTISKWIAALEEDLNVQLVERTTRSLRITDAGHSFLEDAREVLAAYEHATGRVGMSAPTLRGRLRISVPVVFGRLFIVPELRRFLRKHPQIEVELLFHDHYVNLIEENVDVAIRVGTPVDSSYRSHPLGETPRHLVSCKKYLDAHGVPKGPHDLERHSCLTHSGLTRGDVWVLTRNQSRFEVPVRGCFSANNSE
ncbi:MAG: LysR family transcriptional regulator, partial [Myxococcota bacterium]